ncbi:MAG TPA: copper chaperone PCu(A)C [Dehalococcoidia bacterium]|nr:copper chaperone PCu(A)C [Dehalococcoidia bacterium]
MLRTLSIMAVSLLTSLGSAQAEDIQIEQSYALTASPVSKSGAIFMHIMNNGLENDLLIAVRTDVAMMPELHTHIMEHGIAKMRQIEGGIVILAGEATILKRGGMHVMLMGLTRSLLQGDVITITLIFAHAGEITIEVPVDNERQDQMGMDMEQSDSN